VECLFQAGRSARGFLSLLSSNFWISLVGFFCLALAVSWPSLPGLSGVHKLLIWTLERLFFLDISQVMPALLSGSRACSHPRFHFVIRHKTAAVLCRIFYCRPYSYFENPMTGFVNRINTANQSVDRNKKLLANFTDDTVESVKTKVEGNCLRLFLARVWHLTISRYSQRIFRRDNAFDKAFSIIFCLRAEDLHCNRSLE